MPLQNRNINLARGLMQISTTPIGPSVPRFAGHRKRAACASRQPVRSFGWWLVAGADLFGKKNTVGWLLVTDLF
jgi:hypothetical protein